jgi:hypothetical protein
LEMIDKRKGFYVFKAKSCWLLNLSLLKLYIGGLSFWKVCS